MHAGLQCNLLQCLLGRRLLDRSKIEIDHHARIAVLTYRDAWSMNIALLVHAHVLCMGLFAWPGPWDDDEDKLATTSSLVYLLQLTICLTACKASTRTMHKKKQHAWVINASSFASVTFSAPYIILLLL